MSVLRSQFPSGVTVERKTLFVSQDIHTLSTVLDDGAFQFILFPLGNMWKRSQHKSKLQGSYFAESNGFSKKREPGKETR